MTNEEYKRWQKGATPKVKGAYGGDWLRIRQAVLLRDGHLCQINDSENCTKDRQRPAVEVDHKVPISVRPDLRLDMRNLQASCLGCNRRKVHTDQTPEGQRRIKELSASMPPHTGPWGF